MVERLFSAMRTAVQEPQGRPLPPDFDELLDRLARGADRRRATDRDWPQE